MDVAVELVAAAVVDNAAVALTSWCETTREVVWSCAVTCWVTRSHFGHTEDDDVLLRMKTIVAEIAVVVAAEKMVQIDAVISHCAGG